MQFANFEPGTKLQAQNIGKSYQIVRKLGQGQFGLVYEALDLTLNTSVAIKTIDLPSIKRNPKAYQLFQTEVTIMKKIDNINVVKFINYFETSKYAFLVLEFCDEGDLNEYIKKKIGKIKEKDAIIIFKQLLNGIKSIHEANVIHRDLKLPNILINSGVVKIADLGFAKQVFDVDSKNETDYIRYTTYNGS